MQDKRVDPLPTAEECIDWILRCNCSINFYTTRSEWGKYYCCKISSVIGNKTRIYEIKETSLAPCLNHIRKNYKEIFVELSCPPWRKPNSPARVYPKD